MSKPKQLTNWRWIVLVMYKMAITLGAIGFRFGFACISITFSCEASGGFRGWKWGHLPPCPPKKKLSVGSAAGWSKNVYKLLNLYNSVNEWLRNVE